MCPNEGVRQPLESDSDTVGQKSIIILAPSEMIDKPDGCVEMSLC